MQGRSTNAEIKSLTSFRFIAAFYVFLFHVEIRVPLFGEGIMGDFMREGAVGMTMFFVLSGFILSYAYQKAEIDIRQFFWNRFARVYPIYLLAALLALPWLYIEMRGESVSGGIWQAIIIAMTLLVFGLFLVQAWLPQTFSFWNNSASWSISNEAFFYSVFPSLTRLTCSVGTKVLLIIFLGWL